MMRTVSGASQLLLFSSVLLSTCSFSACAAFQHCTIQCFSAFNSALFDSETKVEASSRLLGPSTQPQLTDVSSLLKSKLATC